MSSQNSLIGHKHIVLLALTYKARDLKTEKKKKKKNADKTKANFAAPSYGGVHKLTYSLQLISSKHFHKLQRNSRSQFDV